MDRMNLLLSSELDRGVDLYPLLSFGEARALRYVLHLAAQGDGEGSAAARDLLGRLDRRLEVMFPDEDILFGGEAACCCAAGSAPDEAPSQWFSGDVLERDLKDLEPEHRP